MFLSKLKSGNINERGKSDLDFGLPLMNLVLDLVGLNLRLLYIIIYGFVIFANCW